MLAEYVLHRGVKKGTSLEKCAERYELPQGKSSILKDYFKKGYTTRDIPHAELSSYLKDDIRITRCLYWALFKRYQDQENQSLRRVLDIKNKVCKTLTRMYMNGMKVDEMELEKVRNEFEQEKTNIIFELSDQMKVLMGDG